MSLPLQEIVTGHAQWLASGGQEGKRANFRGMDLSGQTFVGQDLTQASFRNAVLNNARFTECTLEEADFAEVTGSQCVFHNSLMNTANFARAHLVNAMFEQCAMEKASFLQARLDSAQLRDVRLSEANFREAMLPNVIAERVEWRKATLRSMHAPHGRFNEVRFDGVDAKEANFSYCHFTQAAWHGAYLQSALFESALLEDSDLATAEEVDALAVSVTERTQAAQRAEELQALERQRALILELQHTLTKREDTLDAHQQSLEAFRQHIAVEEVGIRQRASTLRLIAASWFIITAMLAVFLGDRIMRLEEGTSMIETSLLGFGALLLLIIHIATAAFTYGASRQLWRVIEEKEGLELRKRDD